MHDSINGEEHFAAFSTQMLKKGSFNLMSLGAINSLATAHMHSVLTTVTQDVRKQGLDIGLKVDKLGIFAPKPAEEDTKSPSPRKDTSTTPRGGRRSRPGKS